MRKPSFSRTIVLLSLVATAHSANAARPPAIIFCDINSVSTGYDLVSWSVGDNLRFYLRREISPKILINRNKEVEARSLSFEQLKAEFKKMHKSEPICWRTKWKGFESPNKGVINTVEDAARKSLTDLSIR